MNSSSTFTGHGRHMPNTPARDLRRNLTDAERLLWYFLRARRFAGCKFRRQHPIGPFIADFACVELQTSDRSGWRTARRVTLGCKTNALACG